ncbi:hypothetical protein MATL_G00198770 [Megalops atlanticus]|uniref:Uncharacterized protein n=1 Tax=Megalops atlanticus TaxID=7932 RepID=A0A9D3T578_MEGAT|nr:hypothetical protein MATL_G00198770 [Megalops atlanticus]
MSEAILTFQSQLSGIMETVLKTAVFEITWLVESSFQGEVVRSRQEVEVLKRRLQVAEGRWREGEGGGRGKCAECGGVGVSGEEVDHRAEGPKAGVEEGCDVKEEKVPGRTRSSCLLAEPPDAAATPRLTKPKNLEVNRLDLVHKEEDIKEDRDSHCLQRSQQVTPESSASPYPEDKSTGTVQLGSLSKTRDSMEVVGALNPALKKGPKHCTTWLDNPSPEYIMYERVTVLEEGDSDAEANGLDFSCNAELESEPRPVLIHTQHKLHGETKGREGIQIADMVSLSHPHNAVNQGRRKSARKMKDGMSKLKQQQLGPSGKRAQVSVSGSASLVLSVWEEI